ncbi:hypothetical protein BU25DRAFT_410788 [Macroventuria anomochaeta]|uniref:Uncharacterized protein n=1 Tax=Macroventuria anomochaeta TaxID=301207 RepID=A0ACB6S111_9PLEO|nr:uncharacterized protein BU25DRAFT_410788 [Macroventuria anomochaeta]KAF2627647.1 hypothetical protein BU25DRAFT_410788 [Macroventuria anomochaeta]
MGGFKFKKFKPKADKPDEVTPQQAPPELFHKQILKREHADHEEFDAKSFPFDELIPRWKGGQFDPHLMNAATGQTFTNKHHVKGEGAKKRSSFENFEFAFCLEWINRTVDGVTFRDRCYNQFTVKSNGCTTHSKVEFKHGPNQVYQRMIQHRICNWGMLKDPEATVADETRAWTYLDWREHAKALAQEELDMATEEGYELPATFLSSRLAEFENWWRVEEKKDKQAGGAKAAAARGYSLLGTHTNPPTFMSRQVGEVATGGLGPLAADGPLGGTRPGAGNPPPVFSQIALNEPAPVPSRQSANVRHRFGKNTTNGRPDLEAKRIWMQQPNGKRQSLALKNVAAVLPANEKENFFSNGRKDRKLRVTSQAGGGNGFDAI